MRTFLGWIASLMLCLTALVAAAQVQPVSTPPCVPIDGCPPANEWYTYRYNNARTGVQPFASALSDPAQVQNLSVKWEFTGGGAFRASPIVVDDTVFIGDESGIFWAIDAARGTFKWQYPKPNDPLLNGNSQLRGTCGTFGQYGIRSSATFAVIGGQRAVIFGAPDPTADGGLGSARLFALDFSGNPIWKYDGVHPGSDIVAHVSGCTEATGNQNPSADRISLTERHERIAYSSPLVLDDKVYVGVHNAGDDPIQNGKVVAVDLNTGHIDRQFNTFVSTDGRGGGVWNSMATDGAGVYFTTGNTRTDAAGGQQTEPNPNHGLSMIRIDKATGCITWKFQPVPFLLDDDPDWAAGATVMSTSCGELIASVQKDGWSYAIDASGPSCPLSGHSWQFPPIPEWTTNGCKFPDYEHTDDDYKRPGAAWNDVFIVNTGGEARANAPEWVGPGYGQLHALNACATIDQNRVRWIADIPDTSPANQPHLYRSGYSIGAPTVTGGLVYIGTDLGHLIVLADPSIVWSPEDGLRCSNVDIPTFAACQSLTYAIVRIPHLVKNVAVWDGGSIAGLRSEPALAKGRVFVATERGHVYMLDTRRPSAQCLRCCENIFEECKKECQSVPIDARSRCLEGCGRAHDRCVANCNLGIECVEPPEARPR
jgi:outer membrane protein assembly factor BamB